MIGYQSSVSERTERALRVCLRGHQQLTLAGIGIGQIAQ